MSGTLELKKVFIPGVCAAALLLSACGGGSSSSTTVRDETPPPEDTSSGRDDFSGQGVKDYFVGPDATPEAGVFLGEVTYTNETPAVEGMMFLSPTGNFSFILGADSITSGTLTFDGTNVVGTAVEYELFDKWFRSPGALTSTAVSNESATFDPSGIVDEFTITRDSVASDQTLTFDQIQGLYKTTAGAEPQITVDVDGGINGVDRGCILKGQITIPVPAINVYELNYEASGCNAVGEVTGSQRDGEYLGVGTFNPADAGGIEFGASNGKIASFFTGTR
ncbi:MAG: hypothetical protein WD623_02440 [Marinobacter sp.]|uniref:hypothetical protein n=1 Tax=Marinobacter sp. TaxID=50741 RepID=UPI0034A0206F